MTEVEEVRFHLRGEGHSAVGGRDAVTRRRGHSDKEEGTQ